jgi:FdhD protein
MTAPGRLGAGVRRAELRRYSAAEPERVEDLVVVEEPLQILLDGETFITTMRTPGHDHELAAGLLFSEGLISDAGDLGGLRHCGPDDSRENTLEVLAGPAHQFEHAEQAGRRGTLTTSACGLCGRERIDDLLAKLAPLDDDTKFQRSVLGELPETLRELQPNFAHTGGLHAAAGALPDGSFAVVREDIGRHNAVDKVVGRLLLDKALPARGRALVVSGRASFEIVQKAFVAGFPLVLSVSAPSSLAIDAALRTRITLIGFARKGAFNAYTHPERISD